MQIRSSLTQVQTLKIHVTPQLKQSIHILQISSVDLADYLQEQSVENPLLDIVYSTAKDKIYRSSNGNYSSQEHHDYLMNQISEQEESLEMMLLSELRVRKMPEDQYRIAKYLAGNLNDEGYLTIELIDVCTHYNASMEDVVDALMKLQDLSPSGVGARNLKECLQLQILKDSNAKPYAYAMVSEYLNELGSGKYRQIADGMSISQEEVLNTLQYIRSLNPRPGLPYVSSPGKCFEPDAVIRKENGSFVIRMNLAQLPKLSLNKYYQHLPFESGSSDTKNYLRQHEQSAKWLIRSLEQRKLTLNRLLGSIVEVQVDFFEKGVQYIKPMNLKAIAEKLEMHESTVSRATQNKYVQTPHGLFELKFFFSSALLTDEGEATSAESVKAKIRLLIENECKRAPFSDQKITELLVGEGIRISRRTVMKYREGMHLLSSRLRAQV